MRGTLSYLSNCVIAVVTLVGSAFALRPLRGAIRCKVRHDAQKGEVPDSRVILFIASCLLAIVLANGWNGGAAAVATIVHAAADGGGLSRTVLLLAAVFYFTCELSIARAVARSAAPGRRGLRNRHLLRFVVAALVMQAALLVPLVPYLANGLASGMETLARRGADGSLPTSLRVVTIFGMTVLLLTPVAVLSLSLRRIVRMGFVPVRTWALPLLPASLLMAALGTSILLWYFFPEQKPQFVELRCIGSPGAGSDFVTVEGTVVNAGDKWWRPTDELVLRLSHSDVVVGGGMGPRLYGTELGPDPLLVPPRTTSTFSRRFEVSSGEVERATDCALTNGAYFRSADFLSIFLKSNEDASRRIDWKEVVPAEYFEGRVLKPAPSTKTGDDRAIAPLK